MTTEETSSTGERRSELRRLETLERHYQHIQAAVQKVEILQNAATQVFDSRYGELKGSVQVVLAKLELLGKDIMTMSGDASQTPAGRAVLREIADLTAADEQKTRQLAEFDALQNRLLGAISFLRWMGGSALVAALIAVLKAFGVLPIVVTP